MKVIAAENSPENFLFTDRTYTVLLSSGGRLTLRDDKTGMTAVVQEERVVPVKSE